MNRVCAVLLALVLACGCLAGCGALTNKAVIFDSISFTLYDGKTIGIDMDKETVREIMIDPPIPTDLDTKSIDGWAIDYGLMVSYNSNNKVDSLFLSDSDGFHTSFGISYGDRAEVLKQKLGEPVETKADNDVTLYYYYFRIAGGTYRLIKESRVDYFKRNPDRKNVCYICFHIVDDKVAMVSAYDFSYGDVLFSAQSENERSSSSESASGIDPSPSSSGTPTQSKKPATTSQASSVMPSQTTPSGGTASQQNAVSKAKSYLRFSAYSYEGLIEQLEFEGFSHEDAIFGADNCGANWDEQAIKKAKSYLDFSAFSYKGLIGQLEYEKFTHAQAVYGTDNCGADWNEQAVKKAESYLKYSSFSRESLISQLEFDGFTHDQAVYGVTSTGL